MSDWPRVRFDLIRALSASFVLVVVGCSQPPAPGDSPAGTTVAGTKGSPHAGSRPGSSHAASAGPTLVMPAGPASLVSGLKTYTKECAACHGATGLGDGPAAYLLYPKPRDFSTGSFRLGSTASGMPTDSDLLRTLELGMPGSAMPPWGHLPRQDRSHLVEAIRYLAVEGRVSSEGLTGAKAEALRAEVLEEFKPGPVVQLAPETPITRAHLARGAELFQSNCAPCHGPKGTGKGQSVLRDESGVIDTARDFTQGVFKGGKSARQLALRIKRGMPGTPMPAFPLKDTDLWAVVHHIRSLIRPGSATPGQRPTDLVAYKVPAVDVHPAAAAWDRAEAITLPTMQLWWRDNRIDDFEFKAIHDGDHIAMRLSWADATKNESAMDQRAFTDGAAVQLSADEYPPFFAMGIQGQTNIWHWKATWERDVTTGRPTIDSQYPQKTDNTEQGHATGEAAGNLISAKKHPSSVEDLNARGFGTLTSQPNAEQNVQGKAVWKDGRWSVVFSRGMCARKGQDVALEAAGEVHISFALWNGERGDRNGVKAVTIWHWLKIE